MQDNDARQKDHAGSAGVGVGCDLYSRCQCVELVGLDEMHWKQGLAS